MKALIQVPVACLLLSAFLQAQNVLVVSPSVHDFQDVQSALEVAPDGAIILVRNGLYPGFVVDGQSVVITHDLQADLFGTAEFNSQIVVRNVGASQSVTLNGLSGFGGEPLICEDNSGSVFIQSCFLDSKIGQGLGTTIRDSDSVTVLQSYLKGGNENFFPPCFPLCDPLGSSGFGLKAIRSNVQIYSSTLRGGNAPSASIAGGAGIELVDSQVIVSGTAITGGTGYQAGSSSPFGPCTNGGPGGDAARLLSGSPLLSTFDTQLNPGLGGLFAEAPCTNGTAGQSLVVLAGLVSQNIGPARSFSANSPVHEGGVLQETYSGEPGNLILLLFSATSIPALAVDGLELPLHLGGNLFVRNRGLIPASGVKTNNLPISDLGVGVDGFNLYAQPVYIDLIELTIDLAPVRNLLFLDGSF